VQEFDAIHELDQAVGAAPVAKLVATEEQDPCQIYPQVPGINCDLFRLPATPDNYCQALEQLKTYIESVKPFFMGYQANQKLDFEHLSPYLNCHINNIGDPFASGNFNMNCKWMERAVMDYYARLWHAPWPHNPKIPDSYWGYVLSMGSTEGNMYAFWNARDYLSGVQMMNDPNEGLTFVRAIAAENPNAYKPIAFFSNDSHYSILKLLVVLGIHAEPVESDEEGRIDIAALAGKAQKFIEDGHPILVCFNYGTTFKGAYDNVLEAHHVLAPILARNGLYTRKVCYNRDKPGLCVERNGFWFHVDGALGAAFMPYIEMAYEQRRFGSPAPPFDFRLPIHSISMSGHKWIGAPWPCGVYMTRTKLQMRPPTTPGYIGSADTTFAGSRNGFSSMILWDYIARASEESQIQKAIGLMKLAEDTLNTLNSIRRTREPRDLWVGRSPLSLTIHFRRPNDRIVQKFSLSNDTLTINGEKRNYSHIFIMEHVTRNMVIELATALAADDAYPPAPVDELRAKIAAEQDRDAFSLQGVEQLITIPFSGRGFE
jgi:histidine decarboxylase